MFSHTLGGKRLSCDGNAGAALPPEADIQRLGTKPELLAGFGRKRNGGFPARHPGKRPSDGWPRQVALDRSQTIAVDLGVSTHSVVTYRRRAFEKLGIATQKELFSLVLRRHRLLGG